MPSGPTRIQQATKREAGPSLDLVVFSVHERELVVLAHRSAEEPRQMVLPAGPANLDSDPIQAARDLSRALLAKEPPWMEQLGLVAAGSNREASTALSVVIVGATACEPAEGSEWTPLTDHDAFAPRERMILQRATQFARDRMDIVPVVFRLLPPVFSLGELQRGYELMLGRRLHKASFRRALHAAGLVEPASEWNSTGRGRPAQLFRYVSRKKRAMRRPLRFDLLAQG